MGGWFGFQANSQVAFSALRDHARRGTVAHVRGGREDEARGALLPWALLPGAREGRALRRRHDGRREPDRHHCGHCQVSLTHPVPRASAHARMRTRTRTRSANVPSALSPRAAAVHSTRVNGVGKIAPCAAHRAQDVQALGRHVHLVRVLCGGGAFDLLLGGLVAHCVPHPGRKDSRVIATHRHSPHPRGPLRRLDGV